MTGLEDQAKSITSLVKENRQLRQELDELKEQVKQLTSFSSQAHSKPSTRIKSVSRRQWLGRVSGLFLGAGIAGVVAVFEDVRPTEARMVVHPSFTSFSNRVGTFITPPGGDNPENSLPGTSRYGLIVTGEITTLNASGLPGTTPAPSAPEINHGIIGLSAKGYGVYGSSDNTGVYGNSAVSTGVFGNSTAMQGYGVYGNSPDGTGVFGNNTNSSGYGVYGNSPNGTGVFGNSSVSQGYGTYGNSTSGTGVFGNSSSGTGVFGNSTTKTGVHGNSDSGYGVVAQSSSGVPFNIVALDADSSIPAGQNIGDMYVDSNGVLYIWYRETSVSLPDWKKVSAT